MLQLAQFAVLAAPMQGLQAPLAEPHDDVTNVLIVVADDFGVDMVNAYGEGADIPPTPNIDALAAEGVMFRNFWCAPASSPARAIIQTGRYGFRTGIGWAFAASDPPLPLGEVLLPEMLDLAHTADWSMAYHGKWHLALTPSSALEPNLQGYTHFAGMLGNISFSQYDYFFWPKWTDGAFAEWNVYQTTDVVDDAIDWIAGAAEPWICNVAFLAPHAPYHIPPADLFTVEVPPIGPHPEPRPYYKAMSEALDTELGRLLATVDAEVLARTTVIFMGDNGTPQDCTVAPFIPEHAKSTTYEGGVRVPFIVKSPLVVEPGREVTHVASAADIFATLADVAGVSTDAKLPGLALDSVSLMPYLKQPAAAAQREWIFAESFRPNYQPFNPVTAERVIRNQRWKYLRRHPGGVEEFYDLESDPFELANLLAGPPLAGSALRNFTHLRAEMDALLATGQ
jgi:arylsulfatase A-like enzyme